MKLLVVLLVFFGITSVIQAQRDVSIRRGKRRGGGFRCDDGTLIDKQAVCDVTPDCPDRSDETTAACEVRGLPCGAYVDSCSYGACISVLKICDGVYDCIDGSDENRPHCPGSAAATIAPPVQVAVRRPSITPSRPTQVPSSGNYKHLPAFGALYKFHQTKKNFDDAAATCSSEGAQLFLPESLDESTAVVEEIADSKKFLAWIGIRDISSSGNYTALNGTPASRLYTNWAPKGVYQIYQEDCVVLKFHEKTFDDMSCQNLEHFICKKMYTEQSMNTCQTSDPAYLYNSKLSSCYKVHTQPKNWTDAFLACKSEGAELTIINDEEEAAFLEAEMAKYTIDKYPGKYFYNNFHAGFHDLIVPGLFLTIDGKMLSESGYEKWFRNQPDNRNGNEHCGALLRDATLNDINCDGKAMFICEKKIETIIDIRFN